ncbi:MAG TPA: DoxX family protein, partial [Mucilaginibacter sp.]|nr:DoxX family protein [Mucilaginibacter sp.]
MSNKTRNILGWALVTIVAVLFIGSGVFKLSGASATIEMAKDVGGTANLTILGILELFIVTLFLVPRTGVVGALLMIAYMGGAMAVLFVSGKSIVPLIVIEILIWITATLRFPE